MGDRGPCHMCGARNVRLSPEFRCSGCALAYVTVPLGPWVDDAICVQVDPEAFFPHTADMSGARRAKNICDQCPVSTACLAYALDNGVPHGIWGGTTPQQRARTLAHNRRKRTA